MSPLTGKGHATPSTVLVTEVPEGERHSTDGGSLASDNAALAALGYKQEFKRAFKPIEVFGIGFSIIGLFPSIA